MDALSYTKGYDAGLEQGEVNVKYRIKKILEGNQMVGNDEVLGLISEYVY